MNDRERAIEECANVVGDMRQSEAGMVDDKHSGQRGCDRSDALYDAYRAIIALLGPDWLPERAGRTHIGKIAEPVGTLPNARQKIADIAGVETLTFAEALLLAKLRLEGPQRDYDTTECRVLINRGFARRVDPGMMEFVPFHTYSTAGGGGWGNVMISVPPRGTFLTDRALPFASAPRDGTWIIARCNDRSAIFRLSWQGGKDHWVTPEGKSYGDGLFLPDGDWAPDPFVAPSIRAVAPGPVCDCQHPEETAGGFRAVSVHCPIHGDGLCDDCPPVGCETDKMRCSSCPRHGLETDADLRARVIAAWQSRLGPFVAAQTAIGAELDRLAGLHGIKRKGT